MKRKPEDLTESELLYELLWKKYNAVDTSKVFWTGQLPNGTYSTKLGGKKLTDTERTNLQSEAQMIAQTRLWKIMTETLKNTAHYQMFTGLKTIEDSHYGKAILYALSIMDTVIQGLEKAQVDKPPQSYAPTHYQTGQ